MMLLCAGVDVFWYRLVGILTKLNSNLTETK